MEVKSYEDLQVWQQAMKLAELVYAFVRQFPAEERFVLSDQLRRAAVSVPSNIAEGFGRETKADFLHFLAMSRGSLYELKTQVELAARLGLAADKITIMETADSLGRMINTFINSLRGSSHR